MRRRRGLREPGDPCRLERRSICAPLLALVVVLLPGIAVAAERSLSVQPFVAVDISDGIAASVVIGDTTSVTARGDAEALAALRTDVQEGVFRAWMDKALSASLDLSKHPVTLAVGVAHLDAMLASGGAAIAVDRWSGNALSAEANSGASITANGANGTSFILGASDGGHLEISGMCTSADVEVKTDARLDALSLACADIRVRAASGAHVGIGAGHSVDAEASNGAGITIHGKPSRTHIVSKNGGSIRVE